MSICGQSKQMQYKEIRVNQDCNLTEIALAMGLKKYKLNKKLSRYADKMLINGDIICNNVSAKYVV